MDKIDRLARAALAAGCEVRRDEPMRLHTTFKIGGPADLFLTVRNREALRAAYRAAFELGVPVLPLGNGSNLLVSDAGIRGAAVLLAGEFRSVSPEGETGVECGAGATLAAACALARDRSLTGLEFAWGIPGAAGGAAFMNAGAYGGEIKNVLVRCTHMTKEGEIGTAEGSGLHFGYRHSVYMENGATILSMAFQLARGDREQITARMDDLYARRKSKQPLELPSAGSVFKRPEGHFAGTLIESCGLKGRRVGGAMVSEKHAGFIVNVGGATCADVLALIQIIQQTVLEQTGVSLECEVKAIG